MTIRIECDSCGQVFERVPADAPEWSRVEFSPLFGADGDIWTQVWCADCTKAGVTHGANLEDAQDDLLASQNQRSTTRPGR